MEELGWPLLLGSGAVLMIGLARRWYRRRTAARQADKMLEEIVRGKDAFRRR